MNKFETFQFLQDNRDHTTCKTTDCPGIFKIKNSKCWICGALHCLKCLNPSHEGACSETEGERQLRDNNFRRCPECRVWVEKRTGCSYIRCKCGASFCFLCGNLFKNDPCRRKGLWS